MAQLHKWGSLRSFLSYIFIHNIFAKRQRLGLFLLMEIISAASSLEHWQLDQR